eukprot:2938547-Pleurochrysis_carterae.AAC.1
MTQRVQFAVQCSQLDEYGPGYMLTPNATRERRQHSAAQGPLESACRDTQHGASWTLRARRALTPEPSHVSTAEWP